MEYKKFSDEVKILLTSDSHRLGLEDYVDSLIRAGVVDLQVYIPSFQLNQVTNYSHEELGEDGLASAGTLPYGAKAKDWWIIDSDLNVDADPKNSIALEHFPWSAHDKLLRYGASRYGPSYSLGPDSIHFYAAPVIDANTILQVHWDGIKRKFEDEQEISLPDNAVQAVYYYVKGHILFDIDTDNRGLKFFNNMESGPPGLYQAERSALAIEANQ